MDLWAGFGCCVGGSGVRPLVRFEARVQAGEPGDEVRGVSLRDIGGYCLLYLLTLATRLFIPETARCVSLAGVWE